MGRLDYFRGKCPACPSEIDTHPVYGKTGDIQTKIFQNPFSRDFVPGSIVPKIFDAHNREEVVPKTGLKKPIGETCCCSKPICACFENRGDKIFLVRYEIDE